MIGAIDGNNEVVPIHASVCVQAPPQWQISKNSLKRTSQFARRNSIGTITYTCIRWEISVILNIDRLPTMGFLSSLFQIVTKIALSVTLKVRMPRGNLHQLMGCVAVADNILRFNSRRMFLIKPATESVHVQAVASEMPPRPRNH